MARIWKERLDPSRHTDFMSTCHVGGLPPEPTRDRLIVRYVYFVAVCGFTFQFHSLAQIEQALGHFERKIRPASASPDVVLEHYWQRWYERLPRWLFEEPRRVRVVAALSRALHQFRSEGAADY